MLRFFLRTVAISLSILSFYSTNGRIPYVDAFLHVRSLSLGGVRFGYGIRSKVVDQQQRQGFQQNAKQRQSSLLGWNSYDVFWKKRHSSSSSLFISPEGLALVLGQETYGFGIVALAEGIYSFTQAPSLGQVKVLIPGILGAVRHTSCPMIYCFI
jgi:hypothetical protein